MDRDEEFSKEFAWMQNGLEKHFGVGNVSIESMNCRETVILAVMFPHPISCKHGIGCTPDTLRRPNNESTIQIVTKLLNDWANARRGKGI